MKKHQKILVTGMTCNHCAETVEKAILGVADVKKAKVHLKKQSADVWYQEEPETIAPVLEAIEAAGYEGSQA